MNSRLRRDRTSVCLSRLTLVVLALFFSIDSRTRLCAQDSPYVPVLVFEQVATFGREDIRAISKAPLDAPFTLLGTRSGIVWQLAGKALSESPVLDISKNYIGVGDGSAAQRVDQSIRSQSLTSLQGKVLRIKVNESGEEAYAIPSDNPFVASEGALPEIWLSGLRRPWLAFDSTSPTLFVVDQVVKDSTSSEEINALNYQTEGGANLGWPNVSGKPAVSRVPRLRALATVSSLPARPTTSKSRPASLRHRSSTINESSIRDKSWLWWRHQGLPFSTVWTGWPGKTIRSDTMLPFLLDRPALSTLSPVCRDTNRSGRRSMSPFAILWMLQRERSREAVNGSLPKRRSIRFLH